MNQLIKSFACFILCLMATIFSSCTSAPAKQEETNPYQKYGTTSLFPASVTQTVRTIDIKKSDTHEIKRLLCDGSKSKFLPQVIINYHHPDTTGLYLDKANQVRQDRLNLVRIYLRRYYFAIAMGVLDAPYPGLRDDGMGFRKLAHQFYNSIGEIPKDSVLGILARDFTLRLPTRTIRQVFKIGDWLTFQYLGWNYDSQEWDASNAAINQNFIWKKYAAKLTSVDEAAVDEKTIKFQVSMSLDLVCETSVAMSDLISR